MNKEMWFEKKRIAPSKAIREKCLDCMGGSSQEVKACPCVDCEIWGFRLGLNPFTQKNAQNPFLEPRNFEGRENIQSHQLIKLINEK